MKQRLKWLGIGMILLIVVGQFVRPDRTNPVADPGASFRADTTIPADIRTAIERACFDCHSNETRWPWYSAVTPVNYFLADDVQKGRKRLNFSDWGNMKRSKRQRIMGDIEEEVSRGDMPPAPYRLMHSSALFSDAETRMIVEWAKVGQEGNERQ